MSRYTEKLKPAAELKLSQALAHSAEITYTHNGEMKQTCVRWYGYPKGWAKWDMAQRVEWWRQHCVRSYIMPLDAVLVGVSIRCW